MTRNGDSGTVTIALTRDSVCMADDVYAPHESSVDVPADADLRAIADRIAASSYLPMPGGAWGWTIEAGGAVVAVRPRLVAGRWTEVLQGDPAQVSAGSVRELTALYVRPEARWREIGAPTRRIEDWMWYLIFSAVVLVLTAWWSGR